MGWLVRLLIYLFVVSWTLENVCGRSISTRPARIADTRHPHAYSLVELPRSMTNKRLTNEIIPIEQFEWIIKSSKLYGTECPNSPMNLPVNAPVYARSICPWYYELRHDPDRFPMSLPVAVSKCKRACVGLENGDDFICAYIYTNVTILIKEHRNNQLHFIEKVEKIPVGSSCVRKRETGF